MLERMGLTGAVVSDPGPSLMELTERLELALLSAAPSDGLDISNRMGEDTHMLPIGDVGADCLRISTRDT